LQSNVMKRNLPEELRPLLPLKPAVFYVLFALSDGEKHGYAIMQETSALSDCKFSMGPATLYTTLQRLLDLGLIEEVGGSRSAEDSRRRYYRLMGNGKSLLEAELSRMDSVVRLARRRKLVPGTAE
jgi:DNA-binding PadR family transcriptional regulator